MNENPRCFQHGLIFLTWLVAAVLLSSCGDGPGKNNTGEAIIHSHFETEILRHPDWSRNSTIYRVNVRHHTADGTFRALQDDLERLSEMGIDIIWLTPVFSPGQKLRTGKLGDPEVIKNFRQTDPKMGEREDFLSLVNAVHKADMKIIIDWVSDMTSIDHQWVKKNSGFYLADSSGTLVIPSGHDTLDAAMLNWEVDALADSMKSIMKWWVAENGVDGFNCTRSIYVPTSHWEEVRICLDSIRPVLMICDDERREVHLKSFDASIAGEFINLTGRIAKKEMWLTDIDKYIAKQDSSFPRSAFRIYATSGPLWQNERGTAAERHGKFSQLLDVMAFTISGIPCLYTGQEGGEADESGKPNRLSKYDKDTVHWNKYQYQDFYGRLFKAHHENIALWNGEFGGSFQRIKTSSDDLIYAYTRTSGNNQALVILNFSDKPQKIDFIEPISGEYQSIFNNQKLSIFTRGDVKLAAYGYQVFVK
jgi:glycosidase